MELKELWFKAKRYGWGWYPATWQGWAILAMYVFVLVSNFVFINSNTERAADTFLIFFPQIIILTIFLIVICYATGETPGWRWGKAKEEMIDVLDAEGNKTGRTASRGIVHEDGLWHRAAHVYIVNSKNEILFQRRSPHNSFRPGRWYLSAGGHLLAGETSTARARIQVKEELGMDIAESKFEKAGQIKKENVLLYGTYLNNEIDDIFVVHTDAHVAHIKKNPDETADIQWFPLEKVKEFIAGHDPSFVHYDGLQVLFKYLDTHKP